MSELIFSIFSSIFWPQGVQNWSKTPNDLFFTLPRLQNQSTDRKWEPRMMFWVFRYTNYTIGGLFPEYRSPRTSTDAREKNHRLLTSILHCVSSRIWCSWSCFCPVIDRILHPSAFSLSWDPNKRSWCILEAVQRLQGHSRQMVRNSETLFETIPIDSTVTSIWKFPKLSQLWGNISPSSSGVRSSDYKHSKGFDLIFKNNLKFWKNYCLTKSCVVSKLSH